MNQKNRGLIVFSIMLIVCVIASGISYLIGLQSKSGTMVTQFVLTQDVGVGQSLEGKYKEERRPSTVTINSDKLVISQEDIKDKVATRNLYRNQTISVDCLGTPEDIERNIEFTVPVTVDATLANSLRQGDRIALRLKYEELKLDATIVPNVKVLELRTSNGEPIVDQTTITGFIKVYVTKEESDNLNSATKEGQVYAVRYRDLTEEQLVADYTPTLE